MWRDATRFFSLFSGPVASWNAYAASRLPVFTQEVLVRGGHEVGIAFVALRTCSPAFGEAPSPCRPPVKSRCWGRSGSSCAAAFLEHLVVDGLRWGGEGSLALMRAERGSAGMAHASPPLDAGSGQRPWPTEPAGRAPAALADLRSAHGVPW